VTLVIHSSVHRKMQELAVAGLDALFMRVYFAFRLDFSKAVDVAGGRASRVTLLTTEIHNNYDHRNRALIVFASDRCISRNNRFDSISKKIFELRWLNAGIGYFGLAEITREGESMRDWLQSFIRRSSYVATLGDFAQQLAAELNGAGGAAWRRPQRSGFHLAGFTTAGHPEFWFVRNVDDQGRPTMRGHEAREDFQRRDAAELARGTVAIYRNGDIRAHEAAWRLLDQSFAGLRESSGFRRLRSAEDYILWICFKMEVIAHFYKRYYRGSIIAKPIDAFAIQAPSSTGRSTFIPKPKL